MSYGIRLLIFNETDRTLNVLGVNMQQHTAIEFHVGDTGAPIRLSDTPVEFQIIAQEAPLSIIRIKEENK